MRRDCFSANGTEELYIIKGSINKVMSRQKLEEKLFSRAKEIEFGGCEDGRAGQNKLKKTLHGLANLLN